MFYSSQSIVLGWCAKVTNAQIYSLFYSCRPTTAKKTCKDIEIFINPSFQISLSVLVSTGCSPTVGNSISFKHCCLLLFIPSLIIGTTSQPTA